MRPMIYGIKLMDKGVIIQHKTSDHFIAKKDFEPFAIGRVGCVVRLDYPSLKKYHEYFFKNLTDAENFMLWLGK